MLLFRKDLMKEVRIKPVKSAIEGYINWVVGLEEEELLSLWKRYNAKYNWFKRNSKYFTHKFRTDKIKNFDKFKEKLNRMQIKYNINPAIFRCYLYYHYVKNVI